MAEMRDNYRINELQQLVAGLALATRNLADAIDVLAPDNAEVSALVASARAVLATGEARAAEAREQGEGDWEQNPPAL
jgi:hypothetical protein